MAKICASLAAENASDLAAQAKNAFDLGADFIEARLDFIAPEHVMQAADGIDKDRAVFTLRSKNQGGRFSGTEEERVKLLRKLAEKRPMLVDVELETLQANDNLADYLELASIPTLVSWHDFEKTPPNDEIADIITGMRLYSNYVKVVTTAKSIEDSVRLMSLYENSLGLHPIIFAMGEAGVVTRVLCALYGAPYTYAALEKAVAPGQLTIAQMKQLFSSIRSR
ncbi:MAG TPA: type I 3-dehydroquinate dehydratase [Nitrososphaera sp.]